MNQYLHNGVTSHDMDTLPDPKSLEQEEQSDVIREAYLKGVRHARVGLDALLDWLSRGRVDKGTKVRCVVARTVLYPEALQYTDGKNIKEISAKCGVPDQAFYSLQKHFKLSLAKHLDEFNRNEG